MARYIDLDKLIKDLQDTLKDKNPNDLAYRVFSLFIDKLYKEPTADVVPKSEVERLEKEIKALLAFKDYFSDLYGHGLEIANWHENGEMEYFDMFYESAVDEYEAKLKKKYTEDNDGNSN